MISFHEHNISVVYKYDPYNKVYTAAGHSKADKVLIVEVTDYIDTGNPDDHLNFDHSQIPSLTDYTPFHEDLFHSGGSMHSIT